MAALGGVAIVRPADRDEAGVEVSASTPWAPMIGASRKRVIANLSAREWSSEPGTFRARLEGQLDSALAGRLELNDRTAEACVLNSLRCLRDFNNAARRDSSTLASDVGAAALAFAEEYSRRLGMERFVETLIKTPGIRSMKFLQGFSHLCAAADPEPDGRGTEARMRSCAQTLVLGLEAVTKPLWLAFARITAAAGGQPEPPAMELGRARARLEQLWNSAPPPNQKLILILDQRVVTIRNATCHDGIMFEFGTSRCQFADTSRSLDLSETELRAIADDRAKVDYTFLGPAAYVKHESELPMAVTWRLQHRLPGDLFASFAAAVA